MFHDQDLIYRQIEATAHFYQPAVYQLLSFYHSLENEAEPNSFSGKFIPLSTVQIRRPAETKIFAIGLIPPAIPVTGKFLDRSETLRSRYGTNTEVAEVATETADAIAATEVEEVHGNAVNDPLFVSTGPNNSMVAPRKQVAEKSAALVAGLHLSIQTLANKLVALAAQQGISVVICQGERSIEYQDRLYAQGRTAPGKVVTGTKGGESWHNFGLAFDVAMVSPGPKPALGNPSWPPSKKLWSVLGALGQSLGLIWGGTFSKIADYGHFEYHPGVTKAQARQGARPATTDESSPLVDIALPAEKWKSAGATNANKAAKTTAQLADKNLNATNLGQGLSASQESTIRLMQAAVEQIASTPPLRMMVNPQSLSISSEKIIASGNRGRDGHIIEHWGEQQDKIEGSGKIAAFYSMDVTDYSSPGLTRTARQFSASYQNFLSLFLIYKNNGGVWLPDPLLPEKSRVRNLAVVGSVYLYYDNILYIGSFDSLSVNETDDAPFSLDYSFSFTVRASYLLDHFDDYGYTYAKPGAPAMPTTRTGGPPLQGGNNLQPSPQVAAAGPPSLPVAATVKREVDPLFGINEGDIGDDLEGI